MNNYELAFIIKPTIDNDDVKSVIETVSQYITTAEGEVKSTDIWGRRALAYPIQDHFEGTYVMLNMDVAPAKISDIDRSLKLSEDVIRYMVLRSN